MPAAKEVGAASGDENDPNTDDTAEAYEAATRATPVDVLAGIMPRLKQNPKKQRGERKPLATKTLLRKGSVTDRERERPQRDTPLIESRCEKHLHQ